MLTDQVTTVRRVLRTACAAEREFGGTNLSGGGRRRSGAHLTRGFEHRVLFSHSPSSA